MVMSCLMRDGYFSGEGVIRRHGGKGILKGWEERIFSMEKGNWGTPPMIRGVTPAPN